MNGWQYLFLFLVGSVITWAGAARCALRRRRAWATTAVAPIVAGAVWLFWIWTRVDWDAGFLDQEPWLLVAEFGLLALVWSLGVGAWIAAWRVREPTVDRAAPTRVRVGRRPHRRAR
jgi:hypothetical protein